MSCTPFLRGYLMSAPGLYVTDGDIICDLPYLSVLGCRFCLFNRRWSYPEWVIFCFAFIHLRLNNCWLPSYMKSTTASSSLFITLSRQNVCNIANNMDNFSSLVRWHVFKYSKLLDVSFETVWGSQEPIQSTQTISCVLRPSPKTFAPTSKITLAKKARYWIIWTSKQPTGCRKWVLFSGNRGLLG